MKKRKLFLLLIFLLTFLLEGCMKFEDSKGKNIVSPNNNLIPIEGTWEIKKVKYDVNNDNKNEKKLSSQDLLGKKAAFNHENAVIANDICKNPKYKIKKANLKNYFINKLNNNFSKYNIKNKEVDIVSISSEDKFFYDVIMIDKKTILIMLNNVMFEFEKSSDNYDVNLKEIIKNNKEHNEKNEGSENLNTALLLGIRTIDKNSKEGYKAEKKFKTIFIASKNRKITVIDEIENIVMPRIDGFWNVGMYRDKNKDSIFSYPLVLENKKDIPKEKERIKQKEKYDKLPKEYKSNYQDILFVGNDYISVETNKEFNDGFKDLHSTKVLPIDNLYNKTGVKISDIDNKEGSENFQTSAQKFVASINNDEIKKFQDFPRENSFFLDRRNAHWIIKGRLNGTETSEKYKDFPIAMNIPKKLVKYDDLKVSWNDIKSKIPNATDAYTSPNKDISIIITNTDFYIYSIQNDKLADKPLYKFESNDPKVVMAEWATGEHYVNRWTKVMKNMRYRIGSILDELKNKSEK